MICFRSAMTGGSSTHEAGKAGWNIVRLLPSLVWQSPPPTLKGAKSMKWSDADKVLTLGHH